MDKWNVHTELNFLNGFLFYEVVADTPIVGRWVGHMIVNPSASRSLQEWVIQQENKLSALHQHSRDLHDCLPQGGYVLKDKTCHRCVEYFCRKWERRCGSLAIYLASATACGFTDLAPCWIDAKDLG